MPALLVNGQPAMGNGLRAVAKACELLPANDVYS
jgi:hypothetical protein